MQARAVWAAAFAGMAACGSDPATTTCDPRPGHGVPRFDRAATPVIVHFTRPEVDAVPPRSGRRAFIETLHRDARHAGRDTLAILRAHDLEPTAQLWMINAIAVTAPGDVLDELARLPEVDRIEPDRAVRAPLARRGVATTAWNLAAIRAPELWAMGHRGAGVVVAVLDTGVDAAHPDLGPAWREVAGWFDPYNQHAMPSDAIGHGTQVAGLVLGGATSGVSIGVAPDARWIAARIYDDDGRGTVSKIHLALQWVLDPDGDPDTDDAADIVAASWGDTALAGTCHLELEPDLAALRAAQIATVFAAGNAGPFAGSSTSPANNPSAFAAGAVDETLAVIASSSRGPNACTGSLFPDVVAPGANVRTADRTSGGVFPDSYVFVSGTSFAAPHVAGAMALLRGAHPAATVSQLEKVLTETARDLGPPGGDDGSGFGMPDVVAAEASLRAVGGTGACDDADGDGHFAEPGCGRARDCDDTDATVHPGACDAEGDLVDQDCDGTDA